MNGTVEVKAFLAMLVLYLQAFAEHDPVRRGELLARCFTADGEIWGPNRMFVGHAAISEKIATFHVNWPDCRLVLASGIVAFDNVVRLANAPDRLLFSTSRTHTFFLGRVSRRISRRTMIFPARA